MSHELRTPLNAVLGFTELVREDLASASDAARFESAIDDLDRVIQASNHLVGIIADILDLTKLESGALELRDEDIDIHALVERALAETAADVPGPTNTLLRDLPSSLPCARGDGLRLQQVLANLLRNAAKFTERGMITISARRSLKDGEEQLSVEIRDTGIGMSATQRRDAFAAFYQADDSPTRLYGGAGLGLTLCQRLCDVMGATLTVESELGEGTRAVVSVPLRPDVE